MKSKILIDVDYDNQPIIKIEYQDSEDVRDKLVKRFMETFRGDSYFATFFFTQQSGNQIQYATIRPIPPGELLEHIDNMKQIGDRNKKQEDPVSKDNS